MFLQVHQDLKFRKVGNVEKGLWVQNTPTLRYTLEFQEYTLEFQEYYWEIQSTVDLKLA